jgi:hypothetical protein
LSTVQFNQNKYIDKGNYMKIAELLDENIFAKGLSAIKSIGSKVVPTAAKTSDDAKAAAALRADQDARLMAIGRGTKLTPQFKQGDVVNVDLRGFKNHHNTSMGSKNEIPHSGLDSDIAKVVEIIPFPNQPGSFLAKVESGTGKAGKERIMHKGQQIGWKDVPPEIKQYTIPVQFISKRP